MLLPALIADCNIPSLLKCRKYADFRHSDAVGLVQLTSAIAPTVKTVADEAVIAKPYVSRITRLVQDLQGRHKTVSESIAEALTIAQDIGDTSLEKWCRLELTGWDEVSGKGGRL